MSLPAVLGLKLADLPGPMPYLAPDPARVALWSERLAPLRRPLIALVWAGRPNHPNDANRSIALAKFAPFSRFAATFIAIQKGPRAAEALTPPDGLNLWPAGEQIADFEDTAAILSLVDLLISVDSSPVHLAGAMGRPAWVLLPFVPDWRWLIGRTDTPWYPTLRLFRQAARGDWSGTIDRIADALDALGISRN
jgi:hypothetical protein